MSIGLRSSHILIRSESASLHYLFDLASILANGKQDYFGYTYEGLLHILNLVSAFVNDDSGLAGRFPFPTSMWKTFLATRPLFSGYPHIISTKLLSIRAMVVTRRFSMTHAQEDVSGSPEPPTKKLKLEATSATTVESCLPLVEASSFVMRGKSTSGSLTPPFSLLTLGPLKIPNPRSPPNE